MKLFTLIVKDCVSLYLCDCVRAKKIYKQIRKIGFILCLNYTSTEKFRFHKDLHNYQDVNNNNIKVSVEINFSLFLSPEIYNVSLNNNKY